MKTLHKLALIVLLLVAMLACAISAPVAVPNPATIETATVFAPEKPAMQNGYSTTVTADLLNIRTGPSHISPIIPHVWLIEGEQVTVIECRGVWGRIGIDRWINTLYLAKGCE